MALYTPHNIFPLARLVYVRPETFEPYNLILKQDLFSIFIASKIWLQRTSIIFLESNIWLQKKFCYLSSKQDLASDKVLLFF
jgi:hypothetical protein